MKATLPRAHGAYHAGAAHAVRRLAAHFVKEAQLQSPEFLYAVGKAHGHWRVLLRRQEHERLALRVYAVPCEAEADQKQLPPLVGAVELGVFRPVFPAPGQQRPGAGRARAVSAKLRKNAELQDELPAVLRGVDHTERKADILPVPPEKEVPHGVKRRSCRVSIFSLYFSEQ